MQMHEHRHSISIHMAAPPETCTREEQRSVIRFLRSEGVKPIEIHRRMKVELPIIKVPSSLLIPYYLSKNRLLYRYGVRYGLAISPKCLLPNASIPSSIFASLSSSSSPPSSSVSTLLP